jgi:hypothetical protein
MEISLSIFDYSAGVGSVIVGSRSILWSLPINTITSAHVGAKGSAFTYLRRT